MSRLQKFYFVFALILIICFGICHILWVSMTFDEGSYIVSGYSYLKTGRILLNSEHPPFSKMLAALPILGLDLKFDKIFFKSEDHIWYQNYFFLSNSSSFFEITAYSRIIIFVFNLITGILIFLFCLEFGFKKEVCAILTIVFLGSPNFIGLSSLVINDVLLNLFFWMSVYFLKKCLNESSAIYWLNLGLSLSCLLLTKFSGLVILPIIVFIAVSEWRKIDKKKLLKLAAVIFFTVIMINILYFNVLTGIYDYFKCAGLTGKYWQPDYQYYLNGKFYKNRDYLYFIFVFLYKTSEIIIVMSVISIIIFLRIILKKASDEYRSIIKNFLIYAVIPASIYFTAISLKAPNLGYRFVIPLLFFSTLFSGFFLNSIKKIKVWFYIIITLTLLRGIFVIPDYISYFNVFSGGSENGINLLDDSNVDWGQDLNKINYYMKKNKIDKINLLHFSSVSPLLYSINYNDFNDCVDASGNLAEGCYIISAHFVKRLPEYKFRNKPFRFLKENSDGRIGYSLYVYKLK